MRKDDVLAYFGGVSKTAVALGISKATVSMWRDPIPWKYGLLVEKITNGELVYGLAIPVRSVTENKEGDLNNENQT